MGSFEIDLEAHTAFGAAGGELIGWGMEDCEGRNLR
jgi:hypothetical protein